MVRAQIVLVSVTKFVAVVVNIIAIPVACALYVWAAYPRIPQTIGGGEPMPVHLIVSEANLGMLGVLGWSPQNHVENVGAHLIPATLRYRTDAGYYVDLPSVDGTVFLSGGAIDGITFETRSQTIQPPRRP